MLTLHSLIDEMVEEAGRLQRCNEDGQARKVLGWVADIEDLRNEFIASLPASARPSL